MTPIRHQLTSPFNADGNFTKFTSPVRSSIIKRNEIFYFHIKTSDDRHWINRGLINKQPLSNLRFKNNLKKKISPVTMTTPLICIVLMVLTANLARSDSDEIQIKLGRCPSLIDSNPEYCISNTQQNQCFSDKTCNETDKCCFDGCVNICIRPIYSACEHRLVTAKDRGRAMGIDPKTPKCRSDGRFEAVQCDANDVECWCVDDAGFELPGTRSNGSDIDCLQPRPCSGLMCRMLCPYGFELDAEGCPACRCRDPCLGVDCPGGQKCHLEEVTCDSEPCPPVPSCKKPRFLDSVCPSGEPLYLNDESQPFLCGVEENKPQCPPFFSCIVEEDRDYGACCPSLVDKIEKPGKCPESGEMVECGDKCSGDETCMGLLKCCMSTVCGSHCVASNSTVCEQQRLLAELLSRNEKSDRGYVPQCTSTGNFQPKQCSRNQLVCWCVDQQGNKLPRTMAPAHNVTCTNQTHSSLTSDCDITTCQNFCEYGTKLDSKGCPTCDCADPCDGFTCAANERCITSFSESCIGTFCPSTPQCKADTATHKPGLCPQLDASCVNDSTTCFTDHDCIDDEKCCAHACGSSCVKPIKSPSHLPTMCEYLRAYALSVVDSPSERNLAYPAPECDKDGRFEAIQCANGVCWCVDEFGVELTGTRGSTDTVVDCTIARPRETCMGLMCRLGCDYGFVKDENGCPVCECRNPCDVISCPPSKHCQMLEVEFSCSGGFCPPVPQCVSKEKSMPDCIFGDVITNPKTNDTWICDTTHDCPQNHSCFFNDDENNVGICCSESKSNDKPDQNMCRMPKLAGSCDAIIERWFYNVHTTRCESFVYGGCGGNSNNFITKSDCEKSCVVNLDSPPKSGICPIVEDDEMGTCAEECKNDNDCAGPQKCCLNGCGAHVCRDPSGSTGKSGQCPYLVGPSFEQNCDFQCKSDYDCAEDSKCCSNGCGLSCVVPLNRTGCEHLRSVGQQMAQEKRSGRENYFIPSCAVDGRFEAVQCANSSCWCVDDSGFEFPGTRTKDPEMEPNCTKPRTCELPVCKIFCESGLKMDSDGCSVCACNNPCERIACDRKEECRPVALKCRDEPCPPVPMCLPRKKNPCEVGEPYRDAMTGRNIRCGVEGEMCPSSHKCHLSPLGEFAVCCPKPREVCLQPQDPGVCLASIPRWSFHSPTNTCQEFTYGGCGGNMNNFQTQSDCRFVCPVLSACEQLREKNKGLTALYTRDIFIPKCNSFTGAWEPIQCLRSLGLCWCVNRDGQQIPGTLVRGIPQCSARMGRKFSHQNMSGVCEGNETVHMCDPTLCENKICLSQPETVCRIDPCDGCSLRFYDSTGREVDCEKGLTGCQAELQRIVNSRMWENLDAAVPVAVMKELPLPVGDDALRVRRDLGEDPDSNVSSTISSIPQLPLEALLMGITLPQCTETGQYSPTQTTGILSWCVTNIGEPIHETLSRGDIQCSKEGTIIQKDETLEVCPNGKWKARVCKDDCINVYCEAHPDAICLADPCNNCKISFYSSKGEEVTCEDKCSQPRKTGICRASYRRYFYNETSGSCEEFIYGGCGGNDNNFNSMEGCEEECTKPANICNRPKRVGMCRASMRRWYFNRMSHKCEMFIFGGCDGNENNFETKEECEARCPDLVLCPSVDPVSIPLPCSRRLMCSGITCPHRDDVICTVDPCNCSIKFVDFDGNEVTCKPPSHFSNTTSEPPRPPTIPRNKLSRCEKERKMALLLSQRAPTCDSNGTFDPTQCNGYLCWCVDEAGIRAPDSDNFIAGTKICTTLKIQLVRVKLVFKLESRIDLQNDLIKEAMSEILSRIEAMTSDDIVVHIHDDTVEIKFVLVGDNNVDVAYSLEEMLKYGFMRLLIGEQILHALPNESSFDPEVANTSDTSYHFTALTISAILVFSFLVLILLCALIGGVMVYRKRRMGFYPRGSLVSLASSTSPLYAYETKIIPYDDKLKIKSVENEYAILNVKQEEKKMAIA